MTQSKKSSNNSSVESNRVAGTRLELLLFQLEHKQLYGINVFKVQEIVPYRPLTHVIGAHPFVNGIATLRGVTMPVIDLSRAIGFPPMSEPEKGYIIITEYNRSVHGFLIHHVSRIVYTQWNHVQELPKHLGRNTFVTAITLVENTLIEILDVEKVLDQVVHASTDVSADITNQTQGASHKVLVVDDSAVARNQIRRALEQINIECTLVGDGQQAIEELECLLKEGIDVANYFTMVISDVEMPKMDGYQLTTWIRANPKIKDLYILLHSSISGEFNIDMVKRTGANKFIQKYHPDDLARTVLAHINQSD
jgi:two-component system chemotaxis response regulator CheV